MELPPRARRILEYPEDHTDATGTTSACAENTGFDVFLRVFPWNYLRVRGEYDKATSKAISVAELPPRARRIRNLNKQRRRRDGTTSACAENTALLIVAVVLTGNYLRVRGEYFHLPPKDIRAAELPPRARRIPLNELGLL